jgi:hypothetical protein
LASTGTYTFYGSVDDILSLYGTRVSRDGQHHDVLGSEELLFTATYSETNNGQYYPTCAGCKAQKSHRLYFLRGERYRLRARYVNVQSNDQIEIAMKIELPGHTEQTALPRPTAQPVHWNNTAVPSAFPTTTPGPTRSPTAKPTTATTFAPTRVPTAQPSRKPTAAPSRNPSAVPTTAPTQDAAEYEESALPEELQRQPRHLTNTFLRHHSLKDVQKVSFSIPFRYEIQVRPFVAHVL